MAELFDDPRFWAKVNKAGPIVRGDLHCWEWVGAKDDCGYGKLSRDNRYMRSHRYLWERLHGPILEGMKVCHRCDNPPCVNPHHLFLGTQQENMKDCAGKSRIAYGERSGTGKLTEQQVMDIRANYLLCRVSQKELARRFGVRAPTVHHIVHGRYWSRTTKGIDIKR